MLFHYFNSPYRISYYKAVYLKTLLPIDTNKRVNHNPLKKKAPLSI